MEMRKSKFYIDTNEGEFEGYTTGYRWNGWATPYFTKEVADEILKSQNKAYSDFGMDKDGCYAIYNVENDQYEFYEPDYYDGPYTVEGEDFETVDGKLHLYGIGTACWIWDEVEKEPEIHAEQVYITLDAEELKALGFINPPDKEEITDAIHSLIDRQRTNRLCRSCGNPVYKSDVESYPYVCYHCDENMFEFETKEVK